MRKFNPEKELRKIQRGNKNKVILFVISLLVVSAVSYSFALYQIRYSKQIIYTTVAPFNKKDIILSVKLDDQEKSTDKFPDKGEGYVYSHIECENNNIQNANWNEGTWKLNAEINGPDKCTVFFVKSPFHMKSCENKTMSECLLEEGQKFENILAFDDPDQNGRYYGKDPANYIWFNCDSYENLTNATAEDEEHNCERWRIIGLMNNMAIADDKVHTDNPTKENLVKIIRADSVGNVAWDTTGEDYGSNNWTRPADLQTSLKNYYDGTILSSAKGITNTTKNMIEQVTWNIGGHYTLTATAQALYTAERGSAIPSGAQATWDGYIGLMYPSDYGYATNGNNSGSDRNTCLAATLNNYDSNNCYEKDWLYIESTIPQIQQWTLTPISSYDGLVFYINSSGRINDNDAYRLFAVRPSLYLKSNIKIVSGNGSDETPYILSL